MNQNYNNVPNNNYNPNYNQNYNYKNNPNIPSDYRPLSPWAYFGYNLLFAIPLVGLICLIVFAFDSSNINRRNYARSFFISLLIAIILIIVISIIIAAIAGSTTRGLLYY